MADQASNKSARNTDGGARCCQKDNRGPIRDLSAAREQLFDLTAAAALLGSRAVGVYNMEVQGEKEVERVFKRAAKWPHLVIPRAVAMADGYYVKIFCDTSQKFLDSLNRPDTIDTTETTDTTDPTGRSSCSRCRS
ncbi:unnamed protein product [Vitrella brassicaformis CCMP3155]|uniref:Uncharacterized protein n=1 Tax=Vitrella brassicaformis (strain CCMP3155) TaxID=1169540 RepID=A0A0G4GBN7_VITBC|nr:unnamed protein product [Vitrella brassicaformis CCMP3155]|eukprot:CEM26435.1 unnamed protein product [Vitrella brassicaformis CCMP3155]